jgi:threonine dehydratase
MPAKASQTKADAARGYGADVVLHGTVHEAFAKARELEAGGLTFVHPFDDERTVQGAASAGLEVLEQQPDTTVIVVPVGGGGLIGGIATAARLVKPSVRVFGVEPMGAAAMRKSLDAGEASHLDSVDTIADGLAPPMAGELNYAIVRKCVEDVVTVTDDEIIAAMRVIVERAKQWVEPSGAAGVAALLQGKIPVRADDEVVAILSGGNIGAEHACGLLAASS